MSSGKWQVLWSPSQHDKFVTFGNEICLYKVVRSQDTPPKSAGVRSQVIQLSNGVYASLLYVMTDIQYLKCVAWYPRPEPEHLLAVGQANGRVLVTCIGNEKSQANFGVAREFVPRHSRQCNSLAWNPVDCNLLAAGLDKVRNDVSLLVWDINVQLSVRDSWIQEKRHSGVSGGKQSPITVGTSIQDPSSVGNRPLAELSTSEPTVSLAWFPNEHNMLVTGQAHKFLRIFDIRDTSRPYNAAITKAVYGVCVDPHVEHRIASFSEGPPGTMCIWDVRNFEKPSRAVTAIAWSPTRSGLLTTLGKDSPVVRLYDIQHASVGSPAYGGGYETEASFIERSVRASETAVSSFSWHHAHENHMLTVSPSGSIQAFTIFERISIAWSPSFHLTWGCGKHLLECSQKSAEAAVEEDISVKMKRRALAGYGIDVYQASDVSKIVDDAKLIKLWSWISRVKSLREQGKRKNIKFDGVKAIIGGESIIGGVCSQGKPDNSHQEQRLVSPVYFSNERKLALSLCGWDFNTSESGVSLAEFLKQLQASGKCERAAAVALFNNKIRQAIEILSSQQNHKDLGSKGNTMNIVAMALSGYTEEKKTLWCDMCRTLCGQMENPYLRSAFAFLTTEPDNFDRILAEEGLEIEDRVAFACKYLTENKLAQFIENLSLKLSETGDLDGILLTGISADGIDLLEKYVNKTSDVQTASLVIINTVPHISSEVLKDVRVVSWIENYRNLLDMWRLWHQRALFDIHRNLKDSNHKPPQQVFVTCNYCGNSILTNILSTGTRPRRLAQYCNPSNRTKIMACPACRKPLPRCALCLVHMGTAASSQAQKQLNQDPNAEKPTNVRSVSPFNNWFTWCQSCRHGGHANHLVDWFREHSECPVTGCTCHCMNLDSVAMAMPWNELNSS